MGKGEVTAPSWRSLGWVKRGSKFPFGTTSGVPVRGCGSASTGCGGPRWAAVAELLTGRAPGRDPTVPQYGDPVRAGRGQAEAVQDDDDRGAGGRPGAADPQHQFLMAQVERRGRPVEQRQRGVRWARTRASATRARTPPDSADKGRPAKPAVSVAAMAARTSDASASSSSRAVPTQG